jgi:aryl-alcohol dehydrogenase
MRITAAVQREPMAPFSVEALELADDLQPGEILIEIKAVGVCHTDVLPKVGGPFPLPMVLGHEGAGLVAGVGPGVAKVAVGDRVTCSYASCGRCRTCVQGTPQYCENFFALNLFGFARPDGSPTVTTPEGARVNAGWFGQSSFATYALANERNVVKITADDVPFEILGPLGCGMQTGAGAVLNALRVRAGESIAVFGVGAVGLAAVMAARAAGCTTIIGVDLHDNRLELARELGATHTINGRTTDALAEIMAITGGGVQHSFDTTANAGVIRQAVECLRAPGTCVLVGAGAGDVTFNGDGLTFGKTIKGIIEGDAVPDEFIPALVELYRQGRFPVDKLVRTYRLDQINDAVHDSETGAVVKPVLLP